MAQPLFFVIVGGEDHPIYEADLSSKTSDAAAREVRRRQGRARCGAVCERSAPPTYSHLPLPPLQERPQYLYHFVLHAALDAVEEQEWSGGGGMHLGVVDRFNALQARGSGSSSGSGSSVGAAAKSVAAGVQQRGASHSPPSHLPPTPPHTHARRCQPGPPLAARVFCFCTTAAATTW